MTIRPGQNDDPTPPESDDDPAVEIRVEHRLDSRSCAWCRYPVPYSGRGRPPSYCSKSCRNRAWEVRSAEARLQRDIAAGVLRTEPVREVIRETRVEPLTPTTARQWLDHLEELAGQVREDELGRQHWHHVKLYAALVAVVAELGAAYPGGLAYLEREAKRRR
ncbi:hypothetical protein ACFXJ8_39210 [Nonomuraea sp. NPDC059194]|uniref:hypothetical protein n=1 Tax=Nonomuraea sp. NPDC059194 TaxID=3346764 RepID=UPI0036C3C153